MIIDGAGASAPTEVPVSSTEKTVPTTGSVEWIIRAPYAGTFLVLNFAGKDSLAASDTNYVQFSAVNKGQAGSGSTALLNTSSGASSTKTSGSGGSGGYTGYAKMSLAPVAGVAIAAGDIIVVTATSNGTLPNTITEGVVTLRVTPN